MNGVVININPVIFKVGGLVIRWYGLFVLLAVAVATLIATKEAGRRGVLRGEIPNLLPWVLVAGVLGARLFHVLDQWGYYISNPRDLWSFGQGGLAIWGALAGGGAAVIVYTRLRHIPLGPLVEILTPGLLAGQIIGRLGCIINGDAAGRLTSLPWGFIYTHPEALVPGGLMGVLTHPYPVYEMLWNLAVLALTLRLRKHWSGRGLLFLIYLSLYSLGRFFLSFVRLERVVFLGLQQAQILSLGVLALSTGLSIYLLRRKKVNLGEELVKGI